MAVGGQKSSTRTTALKQGWAVWAMWGTPTVVLVATHGEGGLDGVRGWQ